MSRTVKNPRRRGCKHGFPCGWCISNRALSREADNATREALKLAHDSDALGVLHPAEVRLIEVDADERSDGTMRPLCRKVEWALRFPDAASEMARASPEDRANKMFSRWAAVFERLAR